MKKVIIGISALVVLAFVVITTVNAQSDEKKDKKVKTEAVKDCSKCPAAAECGMTTGTAPVPGSQVKHSGAKNINIGTISVSNNGTLPIQ